jgi:hypothetical protein
LVGALQEQGYTGTDTPPAQDRSEPVPDRDALVEENTLLQHKLDALALELARREGEAQASAWTIAELERRLDATPEDRGPSRDSSHSEADRRLASALDELDVLRRALAQEHEARVRAESGEELARARAEIERQAVLLEQLQERPD